MERHASAPGRPSIHPSHYRHHSLSRPIVHSSIRPRAPAVRNENPTISVSVHDVLDRAAKREKISLRSPVFAVLRMSVEARDANVWRIGRSDEGEDGEYIRARQNVTLAGRIPCCFRGRRRKDWHGRNGAELEWGDDAGLIRCHDASDLSCLCDGGVGAGSWSSRRWRWVVDLMSLWQFGRRNLVHTSTAVARGVLTQAT